MRPSFPGFFLYLERVLSRGRERIPGNQVARRLQFHELFLLINSSNQSYDNFFTWGTVFSVCVVRVCSLKTFILVVM